MDAVERKRAVIAFAVLWFSTSAAGATLSVVLDSSDLPVHAAISGHLDLVLSEPLEVWQFPGLTNGGVQARIVKPSGEVIGVDREWIYCLNFDGFDKTKEPIQTFAPGRYILPFYFLRGQEEQGGFILNGAGNYRVEFVVALPEGECSAAAVLSVDVCGGCGRTGYDALFAPVTMMFPFQRPLRSADVSAVEGAYAAAARSALYNCLDANQMLQVSYVLELDDFEARLASIVESKPLFEKQAVGLREALEQTAGTGIGYFWRRLASRIAPELCREVEADEKSFPDGTYKVFILR